MSSLRSSLLARVDAFLAAAGISPSALCRAAGVDHKLVRKLRRGENVSLTTLERLERYLSEHNTSPDAGGYHIPIKTAQSRSDDGGDASGAVS